MKVAFGKVKLTPKDYIGRFLAGYTPVPRCTGKYDDIYARGVLIEDTTLDNIKKRFLVISMDFVQLPLLFTDYIKEKIQDTYRIHPNQVLIHATHTHKSLDMSSMFMKNPWGNGIFGVIWAIMFGTFRGDDRYKVWIAKRVVEMVGDMIRRLEPARIAWTKKTIEEDILLNRRHPTRRSKSQLCIMAFKHATTNRTIGIIASYGMHPTTLNMSIDKLSADYPGRFVHYFEDATGNKIDAVYITGPAGDLNPITTCGTDFEALENYQNPVFFNTNPIYNQKGTYKDTKRLGKFLAEKALAILESIPDSSYFDTLDFKSYAKTFWVPMIDFTRYYSKSWLRNRFIHGLKRYLLLPMALAPADSHDPNFAGFAAKHRGLKRVVAYTQVSYVKFTASRGKEKASFAIAGVPGELFEDFAKRFYARTPEGANGLFIFQNANDWIAYLFPLDEYTMGGYEPFASFSPVCGTFVKNNFFTLLKEIDEDLTGGYF
nr:hypothetical protein [Candidatus Sigynarchaeota archaeon]